ncbi:unnamed protein product, partial [Musa hybrid cultivar]
FSSLPNLFFLLLYHANPPQWVINTPQPHQIPSSHTLPRPKEEDRPLLTKRHGLCLCTSISPPLPLSPLLCCLHIPPHILRRCCGRADGVDEAGVGGGAGAQIGADRRGQAAPTQQLPDMRSLHLLRRPAGHLPSFSMLLRHQLQHPQQALRFLLLHPQDMQLLWVPPLRRSSSPPR